MKGIIFRPEKHKAIRENPDREWQTRRLGGLEDINQEPDKWKLYDWKYKLTPSISGAFLFTSIVSCAEKVIKPRYKVGEVVYIKEMWGIRNCGKAVSLDKEAWEEGYPVDRLIYELDKPISAFEKRSPLFMPEWAARSFIQITGERPERLNQITEEDILKEGCPQIPASCGLRTQWYKTLWDSINKNQKWETNPFCWVYNFRLVKEAIK